MVLQMYVGDYRGSIDAWCVPDTWSQKFIKYGYMDAKAAKGIFACPTKSPFKYGTAANYVYKSYGMLWVTVTDINKIPVSSLDEKGLHLALKAIDDVHSQPSSASLKELWKGDSVQFAIAVNGERFEFDVALKEGSEAVAWRSFPASEEPGLVKAVAKREGSATAYEIEVPWRSLGLDAKSLGSASLKFALLANDNDGAGRKGWVEWFGGIGGEKNPALYGALLLK